MYSLIKSVLISLGIPIVVLILWSSSHPIDNYRLITGSVETIGFVVMIEEYEEYEEEEGGRGGLVTSTYYEYQFNLPPDKKFKNSGFLEEPVPDFLLNANYEPVPVTIQYIKKEPRINRVKQFSKSHTIGQWIRFNFLLGFLSLLITIGLAYKIIKEAHKTYISEK